MLSATLKFASTTSNVACEMSPWSRSDWFRTSSAFACSSFARFCRTMAVFSGTTESDAPSVGSPRRARACCSAARAR